jgi:ribosomal protein S27E
MAQTTIMCPYCGATNPIGTVNKLRSHKFNIKIYEYARADGQDNPSYKIRCPLCLREYEYIGLENYTWIKTHLELSEVAITTFKSMFNGDLDAFYDNIVGITRPKKVLSFGTKNLHVCFSIGGVTAYLECTQSEDKIQGRNIYRV